jgi:hypothetical protein
MYDIAIVTQTEWDLLVGELERREIKETTFTSGPTPKDNYYGRQGIFDLVKNPGDRDIHHDVMKFLEEAGLYLLCHVTTNDFGDMLEETHPEGHDPCGDAGISTKIPFSHLASMTTTTAAATTTTAPPPTTAAPTTTAATTTTAAPTTTAVPTTTTVAPTTTTRVLALPDLNYFAENKSDRFLVDFEDVIAGHPHVGQRSPLPHNDSHIYFSNSDPRWLNATEPSDYPPIYAVADGIIQLADPPFLYYYNVADHTDSDPPWWHVGYTIGLRFATVGKVNIDFLYGMEPYVIIQNKPRTFFKDFIIVEDNQHVKKGDVLGYMYVSPFSERLAGPKSPHIAFGILRDGQGQWDVYAPAIFTEDIVNQFGNLYRHPSEGWDSTSFGNDWSRGRGVPTGMGWMIDAEENPFGDYPLDVLMYDGIRDKELDGSAYLDSKTLGFNQGDTLANFEGRGDTTSETYQFDTDWRVIIATIGGPAEFSAIIDDGYNRYSMSIYDQSPDQNFGIYASPIMSPGSVAFEVSDPENWGWAIAVAPADAAYTLPGDNLPEGSCPPGCPPLP